MSFIKSQNLHQVSFTLQSAHLICWVWDARSIDVMLKMKTVRIVFVMWMMLIVNVIFCEVN